MTQTSQQKPQPTQNKPKSSEDSSLRGRIMIAKNMLGLKDLNVSAAAAGHKMFKAHASKNPTAATSQILNKIPPAARQQYLNLSSNVPSSLLSQDIPASQFRATLQRMKQTQNVKSLNNSFDIDNSNENIIESKRKAKTADFGKPRLRDELTPPPMLVLKRTGIRIFPDGSRVAMYINSRYNLVFTIPYKGSGTDASDIIPGVQSEETEIMESLDQVAAYASQENPKSTSKHMKFADGSKLKVSHGAAKAIHMVHNALNDDNKKKFADMLAHPKGFEKAAHFALSRVKFTIGDE